MSATRRATLVATEHRCAMVYVPSSPLGPGQSGRAVFQVFGGDGPYPVPSGIAYFPVDQAPPGLSALSGAIQLADLGLAVTNLGLSAAILQSVRRCERKIDALFLGQVEQGRVLNDIAAKIDRIDIGVAEQNLRSALSYALPRCSTGNGWELMAIAQLASDIDKFTDSLGFWGFGAAPHLRLSSGTRAMLQGVFKIVLGAQLCWLTAFNRMVGADSEMTETHPLNNAGRTHAGMLPSEVVAYHIVMERLNDAQEYLSSEYRAGLDWGIKLGESLLGRGGQSQSHFEETVLAGLMNPVRTVLHWNYPIAFELAELIGDSLPEIDTREEYNAACALVAQYLAEWEHSDAGLLWMLEFVLNLQTDEDYWQLFQTPDLVVFSTDVEKDLKLIEE